MKLAPRAVLFRRRAYPWWCRSRAGWPTAIPVPTPSTAPSYRLSCDGLNSIYFSQFYFLLQPDDVNHARCNLWSLHATRFNKLLQPGSHFPWSRYIVDLSKPQLLLLLVSSKISSWTSILPYTETSIPELPDQGIYNSSMIKLWISHKNLKDLTLLKPTMESHRSPHRKS